ncbi:MAG TPA: Calx-beta domain-containing protein [Thermoanaerobaculia bacterium]|nr:Calx-beta domain-containing protein [Thermoanaerobaculia bacterium]
MSRRSRRSFARLMASVALLTSGAAAAENHAVSVTDFEFSPASLNIQVGDTVTWTKVSGSFAHNARADDGSFRCANGCDGAGGDGDLASNGWSATRAFNSPGSFGYHCELHGGPGGQGMAGVINVAGAGGGQPGTLRFASGVANVSESGGSVALSVQRINGDDAAVSVGFATANGSAAAGSDYVTEAGTLNWADNDDDPKTIQVSILNDAAVEPSQTFSVILSSPGGGAALGAPSTATVTISDDDSAGLPAPAAPTALAAVAQSPSSVHLMWTDNSSNENEFRIERKQGGGSFQEIATVGANVVMHNNGGLAPLTAYTYRVRARNAAGFSSYSNESSASTLAIPAACVAGPHTLCLAGDRFKVEADFRFASGQSGPTPVGEITPDTGYLTFLNPNNVEIVIKVRSNGCEVNNHHWVFIAGLTNVELSIRVTDTATGRVKTYPNPLNRPFPPVQDTSAFATCP